MTGLTTKEISIIMSQMVKEYSRTKPTGTFTKANGQTTCQMAEARSFGEMEVSTKAISSMARNTVSGDTSFPMVGSTKAISKIITSMGKGSLPIETERFTKGSG